MTNQANITSNCDLNNQYRMLSRDEFKHIHDYFEKVYTKPQNDKLQIEVAKTILARHFDLNEAEPGAIASDVVARADYELEFSKHSDMYAMCYYYSYILMHSKLVKEHRGEVSFFDLPFIDGDYYYNNFFYRIPDLFGISMTLYVHSTGRVLSHRTAATSANILYALWNLSKLSTEFTQNIKDEILNNKKSPGLYLDNLEYFRSILHDGGFYSSQGFNDVFSIGKNPYELPQNLFKFPENTDDLTRILFMRWHFGYPGHTSQMEVLDKTIQLPNKCKKILVGIYDDVSANMYDFMMT